MWENISDKIKILAKIIAILGIISSLIAGIIFTNQGFIINKESEGGELYLLIGFVIIIGGSIFSWVASWFMYGFGDIIEKITAIELNTRNGKSIIITKDFGNNKSMLNEKNQTNKYYSNIENPDKKWKCPKCNTENPNTTYTCNACGYKIV